MDRIKIKMLKDALEFVKSLPLDASTKLYINIDRVLIGNWDSKIFKKLKNSEIWEFRLLYNKIAYRLFAFWDRDNETFIVATHGIIKKTEKTPPKEIEKAESLRKEYFNQKKDK